MAADPSVVAKPGSVWGEDFVLADRDLIRRTSAFGPATRRGFFNRRGGNNDEGTRKTGKLVVEWVLQSMFGEIVRPGFGMFWEQRWIDFVNISPFCMGEGCLYRANGSDFLNGLTL